MFHGLSFTLVQMKLLELQDLVMRLVRERNEWYSKYVAAAQNPELLASQTEGVLPAERRMELNATDGAGKLQPGQALCRGNSPWSQPCVDGRSYLPALSVLLAGLREVNLSDEAEQEAAVLHQSGFPPADSTASQPNQEDPTAKQIMQLLREIQNPQERLGSLLENPCIPFFYRADENDEVKIMVV